MIDMQMGEKKVWETRHKRWEIQAPQARLVVFVLGTLALNYWIVQRRAS